MEKKSNETLLAIRRQLKRKKPTFLRQDGHKKVRLGSKWRKPKGIDNKMRLNLRGYRRNVTIGWRSPTKVRGLDRSGLEVVRVDNIAKLEGLDPAVQGIIISSSVGEKKRVEIARLALSRSINIFNIKDAAAYIKEFEEAIKQKKEKKEKDKKEKEKKEKQKKEQAKKKEEEEKKKKDKEGEKSIEELAEEAKDIEKKEKDRILTQKSQ